VQSWFSGSSPFSFKYSARPNTPALAFPDAVPEPVKSERLTALQEKQRAIQIRRNAALVGSEQEVLVEGRHEALGQWIGRTPEPDAELHALERGIAGRKVPAGSRDPQRSQLAGGRVSVV
jgi:tRNA A37 methylthiotransferase MiaB